MKIEQTSDMFTHDWLKYYVDKYGADKVSISMDENGLMAIDINED